MVLADGDVARRILRPIEELLLETQNLVTREHRAPQLGDGRYQASSGLPLKLVHGIALKSASRPIGAYRSSSLRW